jgi:hypothetical protein
VLWVQLRSYLPALFSAIDETIRELAPGMFTTTAGGRVLLALRPRLAHLGSLIDSQRAFFVPAFSPNTTLTRSMDILEAEKLIGNPLLLGALLFVVAAVYVGALAIMVSKAAMTRVGSKANINHASLPITLGVGLRCAEVKCEGQKGGNVNIANEIRLYVRTVARDLMSNNVLKNLRSSKDAPDEYWKFLKPASGDSRTVGECCSLRPVLRVSLCSQCCSRVAAASASAH